MRVLIIGNSHVGVVASALRDYSGEMEFDVDFLSHSGARLFKSIHINGAELILDLDRLGTTLIAPKIVHSSGRIRLLDYKIIFIFGFQLLARGTGLNWINLVKASGLPYSDAVWSVFSEDLVRNTEHHRFVSAIKDVDVLGRIVSLPSPFPNSQMPAFGEVQAVNRDRIESSLEVTKRDFLSIGVDFFHLPMDLLEPNGYATAAHFKNDIENDYSHLNVEGGRIVFEMIRGIVMGRCRC